MRLIVLTFFLFPLYCLGQNASDFASASAVNKGIADFTQYQTGTDDMSLASLEFARKKESVSAKVHPNPSSRDLYVTLVGLGTTGKVIVYDILGNIIVEGETFQLVGSSNTWTYNVSTWHSGTYVVRVLRDGSVVKSLRFIKN